ncbi:glutathione S-transferase [Ramicandelaber brevisporus]|nr:glutathione S-transferase [Ramicandelaber brevisporus]
MSQAIGKFHGPLLTFRAYKARIVAEYANIKLDTFSEYNFDDRRSLPTGKVPALEVYKTGEFITDSNAIAFYLASIAPAELGLVGKTPEESAQIVSELFFANTEFNASWVPLLLIILGRTPYDTKVVETARSDMRRFLSVYEKKLAGGKKYLVGERFTVADVVAYSELIVPFKNFLAPNWRAEFPEVTRYFGEISKLPAVHAVAGDFELAKEERQPPSQST